MELPNIFGKKNNIENNLETKIPSAPLADPVIPSTTNMDDPYVVLLANEFAELIRLAGKKRADYSSSTNPIENFELSGELSHSTTKQVIFSRICEKVIRLSNLLFSDKPPKNESIEDSLEDIAVMSIILSLHLKGSLIDIGNLEAKN